MILEQEGGLPKGFTAARAAPRGARGGNPRGMMQGRGGMSGRGGMMGNMGRGGMHGRGRILLLSSYNSVRIWLFMFYNKENNSVNM